MATPGQMAAVPPARAPSHQVIAPAPRAATNSNAAYTTLADASTNAGKWKVFEQLGLGAPKLDHKKLSGHLVTAYRLLGFIILSIIVIVLVGYLVTTAFFYTSNTWIVPMALSPTDEKIVSLQAQLSERQTSRDRTAADLDPAPRPPTPPPETTTAARGRSALEVMPPPTRCAKSLKPPASACWRTPTNAPK
jgi:hypothetical protein